MKRMFITASYEAGKNREEIEQLCALVKEAGFEDFCFIRDVENYGKVFDDAKALMQRTDEEINKSDCLLLDMTDKPTGRAVEAGMAFALGKQVILIARKGTVIKDSVLGIAEKVIEYNNIADIVNPLKKLA